MKRIFLTSEATIVAADIAKNLPQGLKTVFINTPAETYKSPEWLENNKKAFSEAGFIVSDYTVTGKTAEEIKRDLSGFDVISVSGGNTFYALQQIQLSGCAQVIRDYVNSGKIYIGSSAGSVVAGPDIYPIYRLDKMEEAPNLKGYEGLRLTDVVVLPHWGTDKSKDLYLNKRLEHVYNNKNKTILLTDNQYLRIEDDRYQIIDVSKL